MNRPITAVQLFPIACFLFLSWQADQTIDDELLNRYNTYAGIALYVSVAVWILTSAAAVFGKRVGFSHVLSAISIPPIALFLGLLYLTSQ